MKWRQLADRAVVQAILNVFRDPLSTGSSPSTNQQALFSLTLHQWQRSLYWLDVSGLALYFLTRVEDLNLTHALPGEVLTRLRTNLADSHGRVQSMFVEFAALNTLFTQAGILFCNLKGFTLSPDSCPDPALRCQLDFDFLIDGAHLDLCRTLLEARGYSVRGTGLNVLELKSHTDTLAKITDLYRAKSYFAVEIHFSTDEHGTPNRDPRLNALRTLNVMGLDVPALSPVDQFIGQATHLLGHLCGASTRVAWLLEFANQMRSRAGDQAFWEDVEEAACCDSKTATALGLCTQLATNMFPDIPPVLGKWLPSRMPESIVDWATLYGRRALLADTPGTKLGLLLRDELHCADPAWSAERRAVLVPRRRAPRLLPIDPNASLNKRLRSELLQLRFDLFRLRFHLVEGARYLYESYRWRRTRNKPATSLASDALYAIHESRPS